MKPLNLIARLEAARKAAEKDIHPDDIRVHQLALIERLEAEAEFWESALTSKVFGSQARYIPETIVELRLRVSRLKAAIALADIAAGILPDLRAIDREAADEEDERNATR